jgi:hypothetical protein
MSGFERDELERERHEHRQDRSSTRYDGGSPKNLVNGAGLPDHHSEFSGLYRRRYFAVKKPFLISRNNDYSDARRFDLGVGRENVVSSWWMLRHCAGG